MFSHHRMARTRRPTIIQLHRNVLAAGILNATPDGAARPRRLPFLLLALCALVYIAARVL